MDIVIPISAKDIDTIINNKKLFEMNLHAKRIVIIGNEEVKNKIQEENDIKFIDENSLYPGLSFGKVKELILKRNQKAERRTGWYLQQFLKMAYAFVCEDKCYLVWDSDTIPLVSLTFKDDNSKYLYSLKNEFYEPYFKTINTLLPNMKNRNRDGSYITEHMVFDVTIMQEMLTEIERNSNLEGTCFFEKIINGIEPQVLPLSGFSEFETYGNYVYSYHRDEYMYRKIKCFRYGKSYFGENPSQRDLEWVSRSFDTISFEHFDHKRKVLYLLTKFVRNKTQMSFEMWYKKTHMCIVVSGKIRRLAKEILKR